MFVQKDLQNLADELKKLLDRHKLSICTAESITAGYLCGTIAMASGVSQWLKGGLTCYNPSVKVDILKISDKIVSDSYAVNEQVAREMAEKSAELFNADIAASTTGFAEEFEGHPPEAYLGFFIKDTDTRVLHIDLTSAASRENARLMVVKKGLEELIEALSNM